MIIPIYGRNTPQSHFYLINNYFSREKGPLVYIYDYTACLQMGIEQIPRREKELKIGFQAETWVCMFMEQFKVCPMI